MQVSQHLNELKLCARSQTPSALKKLHAHLVKTGVDQSEPFPNTLLSSYGKCGLLEDALQVFDEMPHRDHVSWASILTLHNRANLPKRTLSIFTAMSRRDGLNPDHFVFSTLVKACSSSRNLRLGKQVHSRFLVSPSFSGDNVVKSSLVDMYSKCKSLEEARLVFVSTAEKNPASWTAMISGLARIGRKSEAVELFYEAPFRNLFSYTALISGLVQSGEAFESAFELFSEMRRSKDVDFIDPLVLSSLAGAAASSATLRLGSQLHALIASLGFESCLYTSNSLIDMYSKCSDVQSARKIFDGIEGRDVISWTSIIVGLSQHGMGIEALSLYDEMVESGVEPNEVTFVGLLCSCSHVGLVERGRSIFESMVEDHGFEPSLSHYTCFVDLLARSGHLEEAERVLNSVPFELDEAIWASLLNACKDRGDERRIGMRIADRISKRIEDPSIFVLLSNFYASVGMFEEAARTRKRIGDLEGNKKKKKIPGFSSVELGIEKVVFFAGERFDHPKRDEIFELLRGFEIEMRKRERDVDVMC